MLKNLYRQIHLLTAIVVSLFFFSFMVFAAGIPDTSFGNGGKVRLSFSAGSEDFARSAALQPDGKIVVVGFSSPSGQGSAHNDMAIARLNVNGSLDTSFGNGGFVKVSFLSDDGGNSVVIQPDGKIVVGGYRDSGRGFALVRLKSDGILDSSFGNGGKVTTVFENSSGHLTKLVLQPDGKFLAFGNAVIASANRTAVALARYNNDGSLDSTFGTNGKFTIASFLPFDSNYGGGELQQDGKILVAVNTDKYDRGCNCFLPYSILLRFNPNLTVDRKFGRRRGQEFLQIYEPFSDLYIEPTNGDIIITDGKFNAYEGRVRRYSGNGYFQKRFAQAFSQATPSNIDFGVVSIARRSDGKIVGCGTRPSGANNERENMLVALFAQNGNFIGSGSADFAQNADRCSKVLVQPDDKILTFGTAEDALINANRDFAIARFQDITPNTVFE